MGLKMLQDRSSGEGKLKLVEGDTCGFSEGKFFFVFLVRSVRGDVIAE